jgi:hypothetical protein
LHPAANDANTIARQNPTHDLDADADKSRTLHPMHSGEASIPFSGFRPLDRGGLAEIHSPVTRMGQMRR